MQKVKRHDKIFTERQRLGSHSKYREHRHSKHMLINDKQFLYDADFEETDKEMYTPKLFESVTMPYRRYWTYKQSNHFTSAVNGFIRKNVGRKWDDVFSEFCSQFDQRSNTHIPLFEHLLREVCQNVVEIDGVLHVRTSYQITTLSRSWEPYYVDPNTGILMINTEYQDWRANSRLQNKLFQTKKAATIRVIDNFTEFHFLNQIWFKIMFIERPGYLKLYERVSAFNPNHVSRWYVLTFPIIADVLQGYSKVARVAISKTTASKREIRNYKLNEPISN